MEPYGAVETPPGPPVPISGASHLADGGGRPARRPREAAACQTGIQPPSCGLSRMAAAMVEPSPRSRSIGTGKITVEFRSPAICCRVER